MRTITLELLRHGPPRNQLLSPLTQYLALCENHAAVTVQVPFEHNQFLHRLRALGYEQDDGARQFQLKDTAQVLGGLLGQVPGLIAELNRDPPTRQTNGAADRTTHLRLVISASELALLPFELALAPEGFPGAGQHLLLQSQDPICLTREVRRVPEQWVRWPEKPRILLAAAAPATVGPIPLEAHVLALREAIDPWVRPFQSEEERRRRVAEHLVVLPQATAQALEDACATGGFTHVHLLAHGVQFTEGYDVRYGLAFHDERDPEQADVVTGTRLATILRASRHGPPPARGAERPAPGHDDGLARPAAVTLASCNAGNVGTIGGMGASVAHALHEAGIAMVVAGQFPLTFEGSIRMVEVLYRGLLWGEDPRLLLGDLRRRLLSELPRSHDWATLATYASLPPQLERELLDVRIGQTMRAINVAMSYADRATAQPLSSPTTRRKAPPAPAVDLRSQLEGAKARIEEAKSRLEQLAKHAPRQRARLCRLLASTEKRRAEIYFSFAQIAGPAQSGPEYQEALRGLQGARRHYWRAYQLDRSKAWAVVQYLSLDLLLRVVAPADLAPVEERHLQPDALWGLASVLSHEDLSSSRRRQAVWALGNLVELELLPLLWPPGLTRPAATAVDAGGSVDEAAAVRRAQDWSRQLVEQVGPDSFEVYSTRRQLLRYAEWFPKMRDDARLQAVKRAAEQVLAVLPETEERDWG